MWDAPVVLVANVLHDFAICKESQRQTYRDLQKQLADFERSIKPMGDAIPIGQLICMALRYRSDQKGYLQPALQSL
jgi:hypothetical protein